MQTTNQTLLSNPDLSRIRTSEDVIMILQKRKQFHKTK